MYVTKIIMELKDNENKKYLVKSTGKKNYLSDIVRADNLRT